MRHKTNPLENMIENTINQLRQSVNVLLEKLEQLGTRIDLLYPIEESKDGSMWLNVEELQRYLPSHPRKQTIYSWTSTRRIPFHKKGRSIMFDKAEIDAWLQDSSHFKSMDEIERDALDFINSKKSNLTT